MSRLPRTLAVLGAAAGLSVAAGGTLAHGASHAKRYSAADKMSLQTSIMGDRFEIAGGKLAGQHGSTPAVKAYGARLVKDHSSSLKDAIALAKKLGIKVPTAPSPSQQWDLAILGGLTGQQFDQQYADLEAKDHQQDISETTDEVKSGSNPQIVAAARKELPTLRAHLAIAQQLGGKLGKDPGGG
jgi:putative membrane protein